MRPTCMKIKGFGTIHFKTNQSILNFVAMFLIQFFVNVLFVVTTCFHIALANTRLENLRTVASVPATYDLSTLKNMQSECNRSTRVLSEKNPHEITSKSMKSHHQNLNSSGVKRLYVPNSNVPPQHKRILVLKRRVPSKLKQNTERTQPITISTESTKNVENINEQAQDNDRKLGKLFHFRPRVVIKTLTPLKVNANWYTPSTHNATARLANVSTKTHKSSLIDYLSSISNGVNRSPSTITTLQGQNTRKISQTQTANNKTENNFQSNIWKCYDTDTNKIVPCVRKIRTNPKHHDTESTFLHTPMPQVVHESQTTRPLNSKKNAFLLVRRNLLDMTRNKHFTTTTKPFSSYSHSPQVRQSRSNTM